MEESEWILKYRFLTGNLGEMPLKELRLFYDEIVITPPKEVPPTQLLSPRHFSSLQKIYLVMRLDSPFSLTYFLQVGDVFSI